MDPPPTTTLPTKRHHDHLHLHHAPPEQPHLALDLGYAFRNPGLLQEALTHSSFAAVGAAVSYERLEFLGDAALQLAVTKHLYLLHKDLGPGQLSSLRSANISTEKLARAAVRHGVYRLVRRNSPKLDRQVEEFAQAIWQEPEEAQIHGGSSTRAPKVLADVVEAIAAAVYEDSDFDLDTMWKVVKRLLEPLITADTLGEQPVTALYELCQKSGKDVKFRTWQKGKMTTVNVLIDSELVGYGSSKQKMIARLNAARDALEKLNGEKSSLLIKTLRKEAGDEEEAKQKLNEFCMKKHWPKPVYKLEEEKGPAHDKTFQCSVHIDTNDNFIALGEYRPRVKEAEKSAALKMLSIVTKVQGMVSISSMDNKAVLTMFNFVFTDGPYNGSTLAIFGRVVAGTVIERPIVDGTGVFRMAQGYTISKQLPSPKGLIILEFDAYTSHKKMA